MAGTGATGNPGGLSSPASRRWQSRPLSARGHQVVSTSIDLQVARLEAELRKKNAELDINRITPESLGLRTSHELAKELATVKKTAEEAESQIVMGKRMWAQREEEVQQLQDQYIQETIKSKRLNEELLASRQELSQGQKVYNKFMDENGMHRQNSQHLSKLLEIFKVSDAEVCKQIAVKTLEENRALQQTLPKAQEKLESSTQRVETLESENRALDLKLRDVAILFATKEKEMTQIQLECAEAKRSQAIADQDVAQARQNAERAMEESQALRYHVDGLQEEVNAKEQENNILKNEDARNLQILKYQEQLNIHREDLHLLKSRVQDVQGECATAWANLYDVKEAEKKAQERLAVTEREQQFKVQDLQNQVVQLKEKLRESDEKLKEKCVEIQEIQEKCKQALDSEKKGKDAHMDAKESWQKTESELRSNIEKLDSELARLTAEREGRLNQLESIWQEQETRRQADQEHLKDQMQQKPKPDVHIDSRACVVS